jgi:hypothetical protein
MLISIGTYPDETQYIQNVNFIAKIPFLRCKCKFYRNSSYIIAQDKARKALR